MESLDLFLARYPEFVSIDPSLVQLVLDENSNLYSVDGWGDNAQRAMFLLTAHKLMCRWKALAEMAGAATAIASGQVPPAPAASEGYLQSTIYGRELDALCPVPGTI